MMNEANKRRAREIEHTVKNKPVGQDFSPITLLGRIKELEAQFEEWKKLNGGSKND